MAARATGIRHTGHARVAEDLGSAGVMDDHPPQSTTGAAPSRTEPVVSARLRKSTPPGPGCHDERRVTLVACTLVMTYSIKHMSARHQCHPPQPGGPHRISHPGEMPGPLLLEAREGHEPVVAVRLGNYQVMQGGLGWQRSLEAVPIALT
jgi:hypothetical protein